MSVREENGWDFAGRIFWAIEIAGDKEARNAFEIDFFDSVFAAIDFAVNDRIERRLLGHRPEPLGDQDLAADTLGAWGPFGF